SRSLFHRAIQTSGDSTSGHRALFHRSGSRLRGNEGAEVQPEIAMEQQATAKKQRNDCPWRAISQ
ncbi:MAG: hypothetical protein ACREF0_07190, partial [Acetobacteraceae bacterium]